MKQLFLIPILLLSFFFSFAGDGTSISGAQYVAPGSQQTYYVTWGSPLNNNSIVNWNVSGGQKITSSNGGCTVQWDNNNGTGYISVEEDLGGQNAELAVSIGISIFPVKAISSYGVSYPGSISLQGLDPAVAYSFQWQSSTDNINFTDISGQQQNYLYPGPIYANSYFRCNIVQGGNTFPSDISELIIQDLNPGFISSGINPAYGGYPTISANAASGGYCTTMAYLWEISVESGPWTAIGTTEAFPGIATPMTWSARFRRKATCGTITLTSNILSITPTYTSPWNEDLSYTNIHYTRVNTILVPGIRSWMEADHLPVGQKAQSTVYLDGLDRQMQVTDREAAMATGSAAPSDVVQHIEYDAAGRTLKSFLAYPCSYAIGMYKGDAYFVQPSTLRTYYGEAASAPTWGTTEVEASPLQRVTKTRLPGTNYGTNYSGTATNYAFNAANEVFIWNVGYTESVADYPYVNTSGTRIYYGAGKLAKTVTTDPRQKKVILFTDDAGRTILKKVQEDDAAGDNEQDYAGWQFTYNVYDDYGRLRFIITPKAYKYLHDQNNYSLVSFTDIASELCFWYVYDSRGRTTVKKTPGKAPEQVVYDKDDKPIFTQDGNMVAAHQWLATLYDALDRPVTTGIITYNGTRQQLQSDANTTYVANGFTATTTGIPSVGDANLYLNVREAGRTSYQASNTITFDEGFETINEPNANFIAEIVPAGPGTGSSEVLGYNATALPTGHNLQVLTVSYYDEYPSTAPAFQPSITFPATTVPYLQTFAKTQRTLGMAIGGKVRILKGTTYSAGDVFLATTTYYDEDGNAIQTYTDNPKNGVSVQSAQYDWMGKVTGTHENHTIAGTGYSNFVITNHYEFDVLNRTTSLTKNVNGTAKKVYTLSYNIMGSVEKKTLAPDYHDPNNPLSSTTAPYGIEQLKYSYNLHGALTGINKDFALEQSTNDGQFKTTFGLYLGYDAQGGLFSTTRYDGKLTGAVWRTQGDNVVRRYNYAYDNLDRFTGADFAQRATPTTSAWTKADMDFSVADVSYDENGNLTHLKQYGAAFARKGGIVIDNMTYTYKPIAGGPTSGPFVYTGNQLLKVSDGAGNANSGDFKDAAPNDYSDDYDYDINGNLTQDNNKHIAAGGIRYNLLDKPYEVQLPNAKIIYTYTASGAKLAKTVTPNTATTANPVKTTWYLGSFVFEEVNNTLTPQYLYHEEGRIRIISHQTATGARPTETISGGIAMPNGKFGVYDYFVKDHQGSTRTVLTEEQHTRKDLCRMEPDGQQAYEEAEFGGAANNEVAARQPTPRQAGADDWSSNTSQYVSQLGGPGNTNKVGPNKLLKVMAGDDIEMGVNYYVRTANNTQGNSMTSQAVNLLVGLIGSAAGGAVVHGANSPTTYYNSESHLGVLNFLNSGQPDDHTLPRAYLTYLFFDENFNYIPYDVATGLGSYSKQIETAGDHMLVLHEQVKAPKNGYAFIYVSNESDAQTVYFDNLAVVHTRSKLLEETTYYPFGLKITALSAQAFQKPTAPDKFQGDYSDYEEETGWNDFELRSYDPQIGRWTSIDPYNQFEGTYLGMGNDPVNTIDKDGGWSWGLTGASIGAIAGGVGAYFIIKNNPQMSTLGKIGIGAGLPLALSGIGYAGFESIANYYRDGFNAYGTKAFDDYRNGSSRFFANLGSFYKGLIGLKSDILTKPDHNGFGGATPPLLTAGLKIKFVKVLPKWNLWNTPKNGVAYTSLGFVYRWFLTTAFNKFTILPVWPAYQITRQILRIPILYRKKQ